ncbi:MAG: YcxB family protein [Clostridia bacterium]|nr:YcxB family protein [Clostridia bacterium]
MREIYEEKELFSVKVKYTKEEYLYLKKFHTYVMCRYYHIAIYALLFFIFSVLIYSSSKITLKSVLCIIFFVVYTAFVYLLPYVHNSLKSKNMKKINAEFKVYNYGILSRVSENTGYYKVAYSSFYAAYETASHFYLYINKQNAYIIPKKCITGNISNFRNILRMNLKKKYYRMY